MLLRLMRYPSHISDNLAAGIKLIPAYIDTSKDHFCAQNSIVLRGWVEHLLNETSSFNLILWKTFTVHNLTHNLTQDSKVLWLKITILIFLEGLCEHMWVNLF